jgi:hypothetical protein
MLVFLQIAFDCQVARSHAYQPLAIYRIVMTQPLSTGPAISRRRLIKTAAIVTAGIAAPAILHISSAFAAYRPHHGGRIAAGDRRHVRGRE